MKRGLSLFLAALLAALTLTACGGSAGGTSEPAAVATDSSGASGGYFDAQHFGFNGVEQAAPEAAPADNDAPSGGENRLMNAKMVYTASIDAETTDFETCSSGLEALVDQLGGYLEYASTGSYGDGRRNASYTVRVPAAQFDGFLKRVGEIGHVISQDRNADNISEAYYDAESRLTTQRTKMERLQALLARAENMEDIIALESAIAETELQIEQLTGSLRHYDALVDFATVDIRLREVLRLSTVEEAPPTFGSRLSNAFGDGLCAFGDFLQDMAVFLAYNWTWMVLWALVILAAVRVSMRRRTQRESGAPKTRMGGFFRRKKGEPKKSDDKQLKD